MLALAKPELLGDDPSSRSAHPRQDAGTLTVADNGIGMDRDGADRESRHHRPLGHARLPGRALPRTPRTAPALIGQFGVGFYSAFMVADRGRRDLAPRRQRRGLALASDGRASSRSSRDAATQAPAARHRRSSCTSRTTPRTSRALATSSGSSRDLLRPRPRADRHQARRRRSKTRQTTTAARCGGSRRARSRRGIRRVLPPASAATSMIRRSPSTTAPRAGTSIGAALHPFDEALRSLRARRARAHQALCPARLHHRRGDDPAALAPLHPRRGRFARTCRSTSRARCCRRTRCSRRSARRSPIASSADLDKLAGEDKERFDKIWEAFGPVIKEGLYEDAERRDALYKIARFHTTTGGHAGGASPSMSPHSAPTRPPSTMPSVRTRPRSWRARSSGIRPARHRGPHPCRPGRRLLGAHGARL